MAVGLRALESAYSGEASGIIDVVRYVTAALVVSAGTLVFLGQGVGRLGAVPERAGVTRPGTAAADRLLWGAAVPADQATDPALREGCVQACPRSSRRRSSSSTAVGRVVSKSISFAHVGVTTIRTIAS